MFQNKTLTISNQLATQNVINGNNNVIKLANSQGIVITVAGNNNQIVISNTSVRLNIFGTSNIVKSFNSNVSLSIVGNLNYVGWKDSNLEIVNNSGNDNQFEMLMDRNMTQTVRASGADSEASLVGRSNRQQSITDEVRPENYIVGIEVGRRQQVNNQSQNQIASEVESKNKCFGFKKILGFFGCVSDKGTRAPNNRRSQSRQRRQLSSYNANPPAPRNEPQINNNPPPVVNPPNNNVQGLTDEQLDKLYSNLVQNNNSGQCLICLLDIEINEYQTYLLCFHRFHTKCIKRWLKKSSCCPLCQTNQKQHLV